MLLLKIYPLIRLQGASSGPLAYASNREKYRVLMSIPITPECLTASPAESNCHVAEPHAARGRPAQCEGGAWSVTHSVLLPQSRAPKLGRP